MEYKDFKMEIKSLDEQGIFEGYASVFGVKDLYNDIVERGAFQRTIDHSKGKVPIFFNHEKEIGMTLEMHEDQYGLWNKGQLFISDDSKQELSEARNAYIIMKRKKELGVKQPQSFGYSAIKYDYDSEGTRRLKEVKLYEVSLATIPANELAVVNEVKANTTKTWTVESAKKWLEEHDFKTGDMDEIANYYAFRQEDEIEGVIRILNDLLEQSRTRRRVRESDTGKSYSDQELVKQLNMCNSNLIEFIKNSMRR